ncbi:MAG: RHS repeat-associated core domain-containing protein [Chlorobi bacterium]|nr:RHS repeat-associated core domain-containing protein [Chlorobiota bacterium]
MNVFTRILGKKGYELKDHLGNVRVVISDLKAAPSGGRGPWAADILSWNNYYPFGMAQPDRHGNTEKYRYGFNGMEMDNEVKENPTTGTSGVGNHYDYGARGYDPRSGRWWSVDPLFKKYPSISSYTYVANNPIFYVDPDGRKIKVHREKAEDGKEMVIITVTAKLINESSKKYTAKELEGYKDRLVAAFAESYTGEGEIVNFKGVLNLEVATDDNPLTKTDHAIRIVDQGKIPGVEGRNAVTGKAPLRQNVEYLSDHILDREEATEGKFKGTGKTTEGLTTLERTGPHECRTFCKFKASIKRYTRW